LPLYLRYVEKDGVPLLVLPLVIPLITPRHLHVLYVCDTSQPVSTAPTPVSAALAGRGEHTLLDITLNLRAFPESLARKCDLFMRIVREDFKGSQEIKKLYGPSQSAYSPQVQGTIVPVAVDLYSRKWLYCWIAVVMLRS
jgi:hypothetical protein